MLAIQHYELEQQIETSGGYSISPPTLGEEDTMSCASIGSSDDEFYECDVSDKGELSLYMFFFPYTGLVYIITHETLVWISQEKKSNCTHN